MRTVNGVIFDLDGTLIDSLDAYSLAFNRVAERHRLLPLDIRKMADFLNQFISLDQLLQRLYPEFTAEGRGLFMEEMRNEFISLSKDYITLQPYAKEVLGELRGHGMKIGVATGRMSVGNAKWRELRHLQIDNLVDTVVTAGETKPKPDPAALIKCALDLGLSLAECVFVGDSRADIIAARSAGVPVIAISTGVASMEELASEGPHHIIESLAMLPAQIESMCPGSFLERSHVPGHA